MALRGFPVFQQALIRSFARISPEFRQNVALEHQNFARRGKPQLSLPTVESLISPRSRCEIGLPQRLRLPDERQPALPSRDVCASLFRRRNRKPRELAKDAADEPPSAGDKKNNAEAKVRSASTSDPRRAHSMGAAAPEDIPGHPGAGRSGVGVKSWRTWVGREPHSPGFAQGLQPIIVPRRGIQRRGSTVLCAR